MTQTIGILTAGGDAPGLNAAIRALGKSARRTHGMHVIGFREGFRGLMQNRFVRMGPEELSGILIRGGTVLGTSRVKVHKMDRGDGSRLDMRPMMKSVIDQHHIDALVCLGGGGTIKNAHRLSEVGVPVVVLPKTIDNDIWGTDASLGFDTALNIATEAIDRLHSTAHSHHRIVVVEIMGHNTGWLALGAGLAGGADVILIPEIPYDEDSVAEAIMGRKSAGTPFSIVAIAEGAMSKKMSEERSRLKKAKKDADDEKTSAKVSAALDELEERRADVTHDLSHALEERTGLESRVTILGHVQRGGTPSPRDRVLAARLATAGTDLITDGVSDVLVASDGESYRPVPLREVAGRRKSVPLDHRWIGAARSMEINLGD